MNGAESLIRSARDAGVEVCFANPGTTEMHIVSALDSVGGVRAVLGLFEGVVTGAADGYARMAGRPALTLLHLGPGFANGIANLHNARRASSPVVNIIGDQATWHRAADAPLTSDIESLARPVSVWVRTAKTAQGLADDIAVAVAAARDAPGGVATLIVPSDCGWEPAGDPAKPRMPKAAASVDSDRVDAAARALRSDAPALILLGGSALGERGLRAAARIAAKSGAALSCETFPARVERGAGLPELAKFPYFPEQAIELLREYAHLVVVGAREPVSFFGYPGTPSRLLPDGVGLEHLATPEEDAPAALEALADALGAGRDAGPGPSARPELPTGALHPGSLGSALAALQPEGAIVMDEAATSGLPWYQASAASPRHSMLCLTGGAIGQGLPCATGAAIACPDRTVIAFQADGSGMYTLQALWTQAREGLDVKTIVCANRAYRILKIELGRADIAQPGPVATSLTDLDDPVIDWTALARGMGVPSARAQTAEEFSSALGRALAEPGPYLIEAVL